MRYFKFLKLLFSILFFTCLSHQVLTAYQKNFPAPSKYSIGLRYNRYGRAEYDYSEHEIVRNCGKRKRTVEMNRKCFRQCESDADCRGSKRKCLCDGECGLSCVRITTACSKIGEFKNGFVTYYPDNFFGAQLIYECNQGYSLVGDKIRICEGDGWWSGSSPVCTKETYCDPPALVSNAIPNIQVNNQSKYKAGTEVEYQCDIGYTRNSADDSAFKIVCLESGKWSEIKFKCSRISCGKPDEIENGIIKGSDFYYSSVIEYKCLPGYRIRNGDYLRECDLDARWSGRKPTCEPVECGEPPFVKNAIVTYNATHFSMKAKYECISFRYYIELSDQITCQGNGRWSEPLPKCLEKTCSLDPGEYYKKIYSLQANNPSTNLFNDNNFTYPTNTILKISCQPGFVLKGESHQLTCLLENNSNGDKIAKWNLNPPVCKPELYCPLINSPENGMINSNKQPTSTGYPLNTTVEYSCTSGFRLKGSNRRICVEKEEKAEWFGEGGLCEATNDLTTLPVIQAVYVEESCKIDSSSMLISYSNLNEIQSQSFDDDFIFLNGTIGGFIKHGQTVLYYCKTNNLINYSAKCINGTLLMQQNCNEFIKSSNSACTSPPKIANGYNKYSSSLHGSKVLYQCFNGYELSKGSSELKCFDGEWVGSVPVCTKINCGFPGNLENGKIYYIGTLSEYTYQPYMNTVGQNKQIRYECDKDYKLVGPNGSTCINGNWKPSIRLVRCIREQRIVDENLVEKSSLQPEFVNSEEMAYSVPTISRLVLNSNEIQSNSRMLKRKMKKNLKLRRLKNDTYQTNGTSLVRKRKIKRPNHYHEKKVSLNTQQY